MSIITTASNQWATRPNDERFRTLPEMYEATKRYADQSSTHNVPLEQLRAEVVDGELVLARRNSIHFSNYAFGQLCRNLRVPASYISQLPPTLAAQNLNHGLKQYTPNTEPASMLIHRTPGIPGNGLTLAAILSQRYSRIWDYEVISRLLELPGKGWIVPRAMDDNERPAGLYASDHDMFAFMVNPGVSIEADKGGRETLNRGFFVSNSEVGAGALTITLFYYEYVCGNHIVWGASGVQRFRKVHMGADVRQFANALSSAIVDVTTQGALADQELFQRAHTKEIAKSRAGVVELIAGKKLLTARAAGEVYDLAEQFTDVHGAPTSVWGFFSGMTRYSQQFAYADQRNTIDVAAGKVLEMAK